MRKKYIVKDEGGEYYTGGDSDYDHGWNKDNRRAYRYNLLQLAESFIKYQTPGV